MTTETIREEFVAILGGARILALQTDYDVFLFDLIKRTSEKLLELHEKGIKE